MQNYPACKELKTAGWIPKGVVTDQMPYSAVTVLGLHCLLRHVCPNTWNKYGKVFFFQPKPVYVSCGYSTEATRRGTSSEYDNICFLGYTVFTLCFWTDRPEQTV